MKLRLLLPALAIASGLLFTGCSKDAHEGHDHNSDAAAHAAELDSGAADEDGEMDADTGTGDVAAKAYPLDTCIVAGDKLGDMGEPIVLVHEGQEVKFCCEKCVPEFEKDPAKYLAKLTSE